MEPQERNGNDLHGKLQTALQAVEKLVQQQDDRPGLDTVSDGFSDAMRCMVACREQAAQLQRHGQPLPDNVSLPQLNAVISLMASVEYPLAGIHWPRIAQVADSLREMAAATRLH